MVAISSSFVLLAILASATAAPAAVKRDPIVDVDFLSNDPSEASVLDVDVDTTHQHRRRRPSLSSRLFGKRQHDDDDDDALLDVQLFGDYHEDDHFAHRPYLAEVDVLRRRAPQTTGDVLSGPDSDDSVSGPGISRLRRAGFLAARRARKHKGSKTHHPVVDAFAPARDAPTSSSESPAPSETAALVDVEVQLRSFDHDDDDALLDVQLLGGHHHYVDSMPAPAPVVSPAAASPSPSPSPMASTSSTSSPTSSSSSSSPKSTSSSSSSGIVYDPSAIKENATSSKKTGHKSVKASSPVKSNVKPKIHASVGRPSSTPASAAPSPSTEEAPAPSPTSSAVPGSVYHTHDDTLLDVALDLKRRDERRPTSLDPLAVSSFADDKPRPRCVAPPTVTGVNE